MANRGSIALKMRYLGGTYAGQDLCKCQIDIAANAIHVHVYKGYSVVRERFISSPGEVELLKSKLRLSLARMRTIGRWQWTKTKAGPVYLVIYYPSRSWLNNTGQCRLFCDTDSF